MMALEMILRKREAVGKDDAGGGTLGLTAVNRGKPEREYEMVLKKTLQSICLLNVHPNTTTSIVIQSGTGLFHPHPVEQVDVELSINGIKPTSDHYLIFATYFSVVGLLILGDHRQLFQMVPEHVKKTWNEWALQGLVFISVASQILLFLLGNLRKYNPRTRIRITLWCSYLLANAVASAALGVITRTSLDVCNEKNSRSSSEDQKLNTSELMSFWAPFFLLHLGGPDTITAYSLEDNELWLRHLVELAFQSGVALYILLLSWPGCSRLPLLSIAVYIAGFIKCYERVQALRLANTEHLRDSMLGSPDPGPNYPKIVEEYELKTSQGFVVDIEEVRDAVLPANEHSYPEGRGAVISEVYYQFQTFKRLFLDLILTFEDRDNSRSYFRHLNSEKAFAAVEIELGFAYDLFYTKANVVYTFYGLVLRFMSVVLVVAILVGFGFLCEINHYRPIDIAITYILITTTILMEIVAVITMLRSDWTDHWTLSQHKKTRDFFVFSFLKNPTKLRWSNTIAQLDLISLALEEKPARFPKAENFFGVDKYRVKHRYKTYSKVSENLKALIYAQFHKFMDCTSDPKALCSHKGSFSLRKNECDELLWSITEVEFDQSVLIWHVATALCYYSDLDDKDLDNLADGRIESKNISDYLLHLLMTYPNMLPIGIGMIRCRDTCAEATRFFREKGIIGKAEACRKLLEVDCMKLSPGQVRGDRSKSVLFYGCRVALTLREMERKRMWRVVSQVWVEILAYAATHCRGVHHQQQLRKGGEFLSHVWLLMAHLGITEQFQVYQGHARARFNVS
ncbi:hypothetical protein OSB04_028455 [Centaurea solstitialis]|uniref:DUF4220 domain-containing protein n=1 Tax=Centaurea solstitialis TaxID=347529 RepID=A0AA38SFK7_9ASTR|nr:hypothetical protein OSB04_028455 [Centaurea solstitialis]